MVNKKNKRKTWEKLWHLIIMNYVFLIIIGCIGFVGIIGLYKLFVVKPLYIYAKVKVGQGMWWATTQRPSPWFIKALQQAKEQKDLTGKSLVKMISVAYYPYYTSGQYDTYVVVQLKVSKTDNKGTYNYNRETIGVGSPIDLEFPTVQFSGTIIELSEKFIKDEYIEKTVYLTKKYSYPWEFDAIKIGDSFSNGSLVLFKIIDKVKGETNEVYVNEVGKLISTESETYRYIIIQARVKLKQSENQLMYGEETVLSPGKSFGIVTDGVNLNEYVVAKVE